MASRAKGARAGCTKILRVLLQPKMRAGGRRGALELDAVFTPGDHSPSLEKTVAKVPLFTRHGATNTCRPTIPARRASHAEADTARSRRR